MRAAAGIFFIPLFLTLATAAHAFRLGGMKTPESFIIDETTGQYYVSNIAGQPKDKDNNGFIARIDATGKSADLNFIRAQKENVELNAPKGLAIFGSNLYVTDIDTVRRFDKNTGRLLGTIDFSLLGVRFLNDLTTDADGRVYVSDTFGNTIYRIDPGKAFQVSVVAKTPALGNPNGLVYDAPHRRLITATWGSGQILAVELDGKVTPLLNRRFKNLDGIDFDGDGNLIVSSFSAGEIYRIRNYSKVEVIQRNLVTPADISYDPRNNQVLIPSFDGNLVFTHPLNP